jgi:hypothetical protein
VRGGRTLLLLCVASVGAALLLVGPAAAGAKLLPSLTPAPSDGLSRALAAGRLSEAQYALERARALFSAAPAHARFGAVARPAARDATLILRDLALRLGQLAPAERAQARSLLARPTDGAADPDLEGYTVPAASTCSANACVHWVTAAPDAPDLTDADADTIPDYIQAVRDTVEAVWAKEVVEYGYRAPKFDDASPNHGPDGKLDVYVAEIGDEGLYGYCSSDDPAIPPGSEFWDVSAYCVVDNDYAQTEFTSGAYGLAALQVTVAHEFFHAVQFAYDLGEDSWFMEATATWMEDEVYDDINDNYQYIPASPLSVPMVPLDTFSSDQGYQYGNWIYIRHLTERYSPAIILRMWDFLDGSSAGPDLYSLQAIQRALAEIGRSHRRTFARFGADNLYPELTYEEGAAYAQIRDLTLDRVSMISASRREVAGQAELDHLTNWYGVFRVGPGVRDDARLRLDLDLPGRAAGSEATIVVVPRNGPPRFKAVVLNQQGDASPRVSFGRSSVRMVILVLTNASTRIADCFAQQTPYACSGIPVDDDAAYNYSARLLQSQ